MDLGISVEGAPATLPGIGFRWDLETEILAGHFPLTLRSRGLSGAVKFQSPEGAVITVDVETGTLCGVEVVIWPTSKVRNALAAPAAEPGRVLFAARPSQPGVGAIEVEAPITCDITADGQTIHLRVGAGRAKRSVQVADHLIVELDGSDVAGFWLLQVPSFPGEAA